MYNLFQNVIKVCACFSLAVCLFIFIFMQYKNMPFVKDCTTFWDFRLCQFIEANKSIRILIQTDSRYCCETEILGSLSYFYHFNLVREKRYLPLRRQRPLKENKTSLTVMKMRNRHISIAKNATKLSILLNRLYDFDGEQLTWKESEKRPPFHPLSQHISS